METSNTRHRRPHHDHHSGGRVIRRTASRKVSGHCAEWTNSTVSRLDASRQRDAGRWCTVRLHDVLVWSPRCDWPSLLSPSNVAGVCRAITSRSHSRNQSHNDAGSRPPCALCTMRICCACRIDIHVGTLWSDAFVYKNLPPSSSYQSTLSHLPPHSPPTLNSHTTVTCH